MKVAFAVGGSARKEWAAAWQLPLVGMLGMAGTSMFNFSAGVLLVDITHSFAWTRAQFSLGVTVGMLLSLFFAPVVGWVIQKIGVRRAGLYGVWLFTFAFAALGVANGRIWQWLLLCCLQALGVACISPSIWLTAVVRRFSNSRGLAIATVLAGLGIASTLWPIMAAYLRNLLGWRLTFAVLASGWMIVVWPLAYLFLKGERDPSSASAATPPASATGGDVSKGPSVWRTLKSRNILFILLANSMYAVVSLGINLHLVPMLQSAGFTLTTAAGIASVAGLMTFVGRIAIGFALDHAPSRLVGVLIFLCPATACLVLLTQAKGSLPMAALAAVLFGLGSGGEMDLLTYLASRHSPARIFASIYAILLAVVGTAASFGPLVAGALFDKTGSYSAYLELVIPIVLVGALLIWFTPSASSSNPLTASRGAGER